MAVYAVGVDLIEIERVEQLLDKYGDKFKRRMFTDIEIEYCEKKVSRESFAGRFAAKEAVFKTTGLGLGPGMTWKDVEVINDEKGKPEVRLYGKTAELLQGKTVHISISHSKSASVAVAVVE
ncbi:MAG: holo-ACP synthase [Calditrichia bacterium]